MSGLHFLLRLTFLNIDPCCEVYSLILDHNYSFPLSCVFLFHMLFMLLQNISLMILC
jgi:hypothetical protein